jgi:hypothetical protein
MLLLAAGRICFIKWQERRDANPPDSDRMASASSDSQSGEWPQFQFALLSAVAGAAGLADSTAVAMGFISKYRAFSGYFSPKLCPNAGVAHDFLGYAVRASAANSLSFWFSAFNSMALNFVQLHLINRLFATLVVADAGWALKREHVWGFKHIERIPVALRRLIAVFAVVNVLARTSELVLSMLVTARVTEYMGNATSLAPVEVLKVSN